MEWTCRSGLLLAVGLLAAGPATAAVALDAGFGAGDGVVLLPFDDGVQSQDTALDLLVDGSGRLLVVGRTRTGDGGPGANGDMALARLLPDGSLDPAFGDGGRRVLAFDLGGAWDTAWRVHADGDGGYFVCGLVEDDVATSSGSIAVLRLLADGSLDPRFDFDGVRLLKVAPAGGSNQQGRCATTPAGGVVVSAAALDAEFSSVQLGVARLHADGSLDTGFDGDGRRLIDVSDSPASAALPLDVAVRADGRVLLAGVVNTAPSGLNFDGFVLQLDADGGTDTSFGTAGLLVLGLDQGGDNRDTVVDVAVLPDGAVALAGASTTLLGGVEVLAGRITAAGQLDPGFGSGGVALAGRDASGRDDEANQLAVDAAGRLHVATYSETAEGVVEAGLLRMTPDGQPDAAFGTAGWATFAVAALAPESPFAAANAVAIDGEGRVLLAGEARTGPDTGIDMLVLRLAGERVFGDGFED